MINKNKKRKLQSVFLSSLVALAITFAAVIGSTDYVIPKTKSIGREVGTQQIGVQATESEIMEGTAKLLGIPVKDIKVNVLPQKKLIPCGDVFGVKFFTKGVIVVGMSDIESTEGILNPAYKSGIRTGDVIIEIDGSPVNTVEEIAQRVDKSNGESLEIKFTRDGKNYTTTLIPLIALSDGKYKTGLWIRDSTAGIGTITYYNPETGEFGGLGHGICDVDTGTLMPMLRGNIVDISVTDIVKGIDGMPGEIKGSFGSIRQGELYGNTEEGVFGRLNFKPECAFEEPLEIGQSSKVHEGEAYIYSSLGDNKINKYRIELAKIYRNNQDTKNFIFTVTDKELLQRTGGIIQGMSGSPIVQDDKLIGAVTHVLVNNPQKGYGIFIENMLSEADKIQ